MPLPVINYAALQPQGNPLARALGQLPNEMQAYQQQQLANALSQATLPYAAPMQQAKLEQLQNINQFYPKMQQSEIERNKSLTENQNAQTEKLKQLLNYLRNLGENPSDKTSTNIPSPQTSPTEDASKGTSVSDMSAPYGIPTPKPTSQDLINKEVFGLDTYGKKLDQAINQQSQQKKDYLAKAINVNKDAESIIKNTQLMDQFNYWTDKMNVGGKLADWTPNLSSAAQNAQQIASEMSLGGIQSVRNAMDSARFSNVDTNIALSMKPQLSWNSGTRERYSNYLNAVKNRTLQMRDFYNYISQNPNLEADTSTADALWSLYQEQYPITSRKGDSFTVHNRDEWKKFTTPEAIQTYKKNGFYRPINKSHVTEKNIQDTMNATGLSKKEIMEKLKERGVL